jgi:hypothetical protein
VPQRSFATIAGDALALTVANRGNAEVEAVPEADGSTSIAVTVLRAVGWLSGTDLGLRPAPAGPPFATPGAQVPGPHTAELSLRFHAPDDPMRVADAHAFAAPPLAFLATGSGEGHGALRDGARLVEVDDPAVVISAIEPAGDDEGDATNGAVLVRLWNASDLAREARVRFAARPGARIDAVDLAGRADPAVRIRAEGDAVRLALRPAQIVTLRVR